jgi:hypothetical protein
VHSIITIKQDEDKIIPVDSHKVFCIAGEAGDRVQFSDYIIANVKLYSLRNSTSLSTRSVANYARGELATALRKVCVSVCLTQRMHACHAGSRHLRQATRHAGESLCAPWQTPMHVRSHTIIMPDLLHPVTRPCPAAVPIPVQPAGRRLRRRSWCLPVLVRLLGHPAQGQHRGHRIR